MATNVNYFFAFYLTVILFPFTIALVLGVGGAIVDRVRAGRDPAND